MHRNVGQISCCDSRRVSNSSRIMRIAFMRRGTESASVSGLPKISDVFDDKREWWIGYPLTKTAVPHRQTLYLQERCILAGLFQEIHDVILASDKKQIMTMREFSNAVDCLSVKMQHWYENLPLELRYHWPMSIAVWELQCVPCSHV